jgi:ribosomal protein S27E
MKTFSEVEKEFANITCPDCGTDKIIYDVISGGTRIVTKGEQSMPSTYVAKCDNPSCNKYEIVIAHQQFSD